MLALVYCGHLANGEPVGERGDWQAAESSSSARLTLPASRYARLLRRTLQSPNSYFMDVRCPGCFAITTVFSHATTVVVCGSCALMLCQPTGGKARLTEGCSFRRKQE